MQNMYYQNMLPDPGEWGHYAVELLGAGGAGFLLREIVKRIFERANRSDDIEFGLRSEMVKRLETLETQYALLEVRERVTFEKAVRLEGENIALRRRYHDLLNWINHQPGMPVVPVWLYERVIGPTEQATHEQRPHYDSETEGTPP